MGSAAQAPGEGRKAATPPRVRPKADARGKVPTGADAHVLMILVDSSFRSLAFQEEVEEAIQAMSEPTQDRYRALLPASMELSIASTDAQHGPSPSTAPTAPCFYQAHEASTREAPRRGVPDFLSRSQPVVPTMAEVRGNCSPPLVGRVAVDRQTFPKSQEVYSEQNGQ
eukprot:Skav200160  [mRNA]  locus=scaffold6219:3079:8155:- [translate_table: standard]